MDYFFQSIYYMLLWRPTPTFRDAGYYVHQHWNLVTFPNNVSYHNSWYCIVFLWCKMIMIHNKILHIYTHLLIFKWTQKNRSSKIHLNITMLCYLGMYLKTAFAKIWPIWLDLEMKEIFWPVLSNVYYWTFTPANTKTWFTNRALISTNQFNWGNPSWYHYDNLSLITTFDKQHFTWITFPGHWVLIQFAECYQQVLLYNQLVLQAVNSTLSCFLCQHVFKSQS